MALMGRPSSHTFQTFAENQAKSPWEPYHVSLGFAAEDSCVTVAPARSNGSPSATTVFGGGAVEPWTPQIILDNIVDAIARGRSGLTVWKLGSAMPSPRRQNLFLHPDLAIELNRLGYTRKSLAEYLFWRASVPYEELTPAEKQSLEASRMGDSPRKCVATFKEGLKPGGRVPMLNSPEDCHLWWPEEPRDTLSGLLISPYRPMGQRRS